MKTSVIGTILLLFQMIHSTSFGQENLDLRFQITLGENKLELNKTIFSSTIGDSISISRLKFYITNVQLGSVEKEQLKNSSEPFLIDLSDTTSLHRRVELDFKPDFIRFQLGVDSLINEGGARGGKFDPTHGMYWSWQSGYVNFKMEGKTPKCKERKNEFNMHLGGYAEPYNSIVSVMLFVENPKINTITINLDIENILSQHDWEGSPSIMSPSRRAVELSKLVSSQFRILE